MFVAACSGLAGLLASGHFRLHFLSLLRSTRIMDKHCCTGLCLGSEDLDSWPCTCAASALYTAKIGTLPVSAWRVKAGRRPDLSGLACACSSCNLTISFAGAVEFKEGHVRKHPCVLSTFSEKVPGNDSPRRAAFGNGSPQSLEPCIKLHCWS